MSDVIELDSEEVSNTNESQNVDVIEKSNNLSSSVEQESRISETKTDINVNRDKPRHVQNIESSTVSKANELDKFKRRLIRVIARSLLVEKKPEEEIWEELKKETSCDCKLLWTRMRAVTVKKLRRLFVAEDKIDNITKIAQLSVTDWLLFDLVLVHENVDVIGQDEQDIHKNENDPKILEELFQSVVTHKIEYLQGDALTKAWYDLTQEYNRCGRKCSPMLLQRRWFQLKELVWYNFYNFWFSYRGDARRLTDAIHYKPTRLQREIIKCFNKIVTQQFPTWEQLIEEKKVSLPADFERLQLSKKKRKFAENEPDLVVIEPHVETIDLRLESDSESKHEDSDNESDSKEADVKATDSKLDLTVVKTETIKDVSDEDDVSLLETVHIPVESLESSMARQEQASNNVNVIISDDDRDTVTHTINEEARSNGKSNQSKKNIGMQNEALCEISKDLITNFQDSHNDEQWQNVDKNNVHDDPVIIDDDSSNSKKVNELNNENETECLDDTQLQIITNDVVKNKIINDIGTPDEINDILQGVVDRITKTKLNRETEERRNVAKSNLVSNINEESTNLVNNCGVPTQNSDLNDAVFIDGFELEDDGIEYVEDEEDMTVKVIKTENTEDHMGENPPKIDLKLLLNPVVYTKRLDDMVVFRFVDYESVRDGRIIKNALLESLSDDKTSINMENISEECQKASENDSSSDELLNAYDCRHKVSAKSWYFRKPKVVSYNPIQLCKNPDFNTRLKRLTAGFFSSERNRRLLQDCKPLTVDVHKLFEIKLNNNSLLVEGFPSRVIDQRETMKTFDKTVIPSFPVKTLAETHGASPVSYYSSNNTENILPNTELLKQLLPKTTTSNQSHTVEPSIERNKVINLPDINQIRRTNEKLLIAEVTPIQCKGDKKAPVEIIQKKVYNTENNSVIISNKHEFSELDPVKLNDNMNVLTKLLSNSEVSNAPKLLPVLEKNTNKNETLTKLDVQIQGKSGAKEQGFKLKKSYKRKVAPPPPSPTTIQRKIPEFVRKGMPTDRLLAMDTVERILSVCQGEIIPKKCKNKAKSKKKAEVGKSASDQPILIKDVTDALIEQCVKNAKSVVTPPKDEAEKQDNQPQPKQIVKRPKKQTNKDCCWARRQMRFFKTKSIRSRPHQCPVAKCICCCQEEYKNVLQKRNLELYPTIAGLKDLNSDDEKDATQNTKLVTATKGVNTDYDPKFSGKLLKASKTSHQVSVNVETSNKSSPINTLNDNQPQISLPTTKEITFQEDGFTEGLNPIITNVQSLSQPLATTLPLQDKNDTNMMKCKTNVVFSPGPYYLTSSNKSTKSIPETPDNKVYAMNDKSGISQTPIYLGKNKILLCSEKPIEEVDSTVEEQAFLPQIANQELLPPGVHLTLIPNNELALSIDSDVELDNTQLSRLPSIIASIQQEFKSAQDKALIEGSTNNRYNTAAVADNEVTSLDEEHNVESCDENPNQDNRNVEETSDAVDNLKIDILGSTDTSNLVASVVECESTKEINMNKNVTSNDDSTSVFEIQYDNQSASDQPILIKVVTDALIKQCVKKKISAIAPPTDKAEKQDNKPQPKQTVKIARSQNKNDCCWASRQMRFFKTKSIRSRPHKCPVAKCICCCQEKYKNVLQKRNLELYPTIAGLKDLDSDDKKDATQNTKLVTKEMNTDCDPKFSVNLLKASKTSHQVSVNVETSNKSNPINTLNDNQPQTSLPTTKEITIQEDGFTEGLKPIITSVQSLSQPLATTLPLQDKHNTNIMECKTNVVFSPGPFHLNSPNKSTKPIPETLKKVKLLTPDNKVYVMNDKSGISRTPISLGKNKILLCSVKPIEEVDSTVEEQAFLPQIANQELLPPGVHLTLISNNELALSIDSGVALDNTQLSRLPSIIASIQQEFNSAQDEALIEGSTNNRYDTAAVADNEVTLLDEEHNVERCDVNPNQDNINVKEINDAVDNLKIDILGSTDTSNLVASVVECESTKEVNMNENFTSNEDSASVLEVQSDSNEIIHSEKPTDLNKKNDHGVVSNAIQGSAKKTILSDLMEMSGISVEDTSIASIENNSERDNIETEILETQPFLNSKVKGSPSIKPVKSVNKAICPELNIVTSFLELKYAYENNGQFYKMDVDTGKIIPINVQIKKRTAPKFKPILPKTVIDLTDDGENEDQEIAINNPEQQIISVEPLKAVKPIRLIKAIHPSILKRSGKSLLIKHHTGEPDAKYKKKNIIKLVKRKRKQDIEILNVESPSELAALNEMVNINRTIEKIQHSGSESDDEPLAFKAKRRKGNYQIQTLQEPKENKSQREDACEDQKSDCNFSKDDVDTEEPEDSMNTILEPVAFNDNSDEDCILGV